MGASADEGVVGNGVGPQPGLPDLLEEVEGRARGQRSRLSPGIDEGVEAHEVGLEAQVAHRIQQLLNLGEPPGPGVDPHHGVEHLDGGIARVRAAENLLGKGVLVGATKDGDDNGKDAGAGGVASTKGKPLEHLEGAGPAVATNPLDDEGEVGGGHLDAAVIENVCNESGGRESEDPIGEELDALPPVAGALEGKLRHLLGPGPALLAV